MAAHARVGLVAVCCCCFPDTMMQRRQARLTHQQGARSSSTGLQQIQAMQLQLHGVGAETGLAVLLLLLLLQLGSERQSTRRLRRTSGREQLSANHICIYEQVFDRGRGGRDSFCAAITLMWLTIWSELWQRQPATRYGASGMNRGVLRAARHMEWFCTSQSCH